MMIPSSTRLSGAGNGSGQPVLFVSRAASIGPNTGWSLWPGSPSRILVGPVLVAAMFTTGSWVVPGVIGLVVLIPAIVSGVSVGIKRLHDRDSTGWWLLLFYLVPGVLQSGGGPQIGIGLLLPLAGLADLHLGDRRAWAVCRAPPDQINTDPIRWRASRGSRRNVARDDDIPEDPLSPGDEQDRRSRCHRPRSHPLPVGDAGGGRRARLSRSGG